MTTAVLDRPDDLARRWHRFREEHPKIRIRDAAAELGVSEAELVATGRGTTVTQLRGPWGDLLKAVPGLGHVMALTRNEHAVHERHGVYRDIQVRGAMALVLGDDIDLRIFLERWRFGFAVFEGERRSLQFFDEAGRAVHKIYATEKTNFAAWESLVAGFRAPGGAGRLAVEPPSTPAVARPDREIDVAGLAGAWRALRDTHDFFGLLKRFGVQRLQALRLIGADLAEQIPAGAARTTLEQAAAGAVPVMVFVGSPGVIQVHSGTVTRLRMVGDWFNVLDPEFSLHLREPGVASAWVVRKPTVDGIVTSVELFDRDGETIALLFGKRKPGQPESEAWRRLVARLPRLGTTP